MLSNGSGPLTGCWEQIPSSHWPACVTNAVLGWIGVPSSDSPSAQVQTATSTPRIFPARTQAKLKQLAAWLPRPRSAGHTCAGAALCLVDRLQSLIACGMCPWSAYSDHMPLLGGGSQLPCILPPLRSPIAGPVKIGQIHWAAGKGAVPVAVLTVIVPPVGVQVEAAQSAKSPRQNLKSCGKPCALTCGAASSTIPLRAERTRAYRNMDSSSLSRLDSRELRLNSGDRASSIESMATFEFEEAAKGDPRRDRPAGAEPVEHQRPLPAQHARHLLHWCLARARMVWADQRSTNLPAQRPNR